MNSKIEHRNGKRPILRVFYDPSKRNWDEAIRQALESHGLKRPDVLVICEPGQKGKIDA